MVVIYGKGPREASEEFISSSRNWSPELSALFFFPCPLPFLCPPTVLQNHLVYNLSAQDASPSPKMLMGTEEFFVDHHITTTIAVNKNLQILFLFTQTGGL